MRKVYIPGVWDLFHIGHLNVIREAKKLGDFLFVGVCSDEICIRTKGLPAIKEEWRLEVIESIKYVDCGIIYRDMDYYQTAKKLGADILAVGEDFGYLPEHRKAIDLCIENGMDLVKIPRYSGISSTLIKESIKQI